MVALWVVALVVLGLACGGEPVGEKAPVAPVGEQAPVAPPPPVQATAGRDRDYDRATFETLRWGEPAPYAPFGASSSLPPSKEDGYGPQNIADDSPFTAWVEGKPDDGVGEWVELRVPCVPAEGQKARLVVFNGYQKSRGSFEDNGRAKELAVAVDGVDRGRIALADAMGPQEVPIAVGWGGTVRLTITAVFPGRKWRDTAISEVFISCGDGPLPDPGPGDERCCLVDYPDTRRARTGVALAECRALTNEEDGVLAVWSAGRICETVCCRLTTAGMPPDGPDEVRHERMPLGSCSEETLVAAEVVADPHCR